MKFVERHAHLDLDPKVRRRLLGANTATLDRPFKPIRATAGSRRKRRKRQSMGRYVRVRTRPRIMAMNGTGHHRVYWRLTWRPTAAGRCRAPSSTAW